MERYERHMFYKKATKAASAIAELIDDTNLLVEYTSAAGMVGILLNTGNVLDAAHYAVEGENIRQQIVAKFTPQQGVDIELFEKSLSSIRNTIRSFDLFYEVVGFTVVRIS